MTIEVFILPYSVPCERLIHELKRFQLNFPDIKLDFFNVLDHPEYARVKRIKTIPTIVVKQDKSEIIRIEKWISYEDLIDKIKIS